MFSSHFIRMSDMFYALQLSLISRRSSRNDIVRELSACLYVIIIRMLFPLFSDEWLLGCRLLAAIRAARAATCHCRVRRRRPLGRRLVGTRAHWRQRHLSHLRATRPPGRPSLETTSFLGCGSEIAETSSLRSKCASPSRAHRLGSPRPDVAAPTSGDARSSASFVKSRAWNDRWKRGRDGAAARASESNAQKDVRINRKREKEKERGRVGREPHDDVQSIRLQVACVRACMYMLVPRSALCQVQRVPTAVPTATSYSGKESGYGTAYGKRELEVESESRSFSALPPSWLAGGRSELDSKILRRFLVAGGEFFSRESRFRRAQPGGDEWQRFWRGCKSVSTQ